MSLFSPLLLDFCQREWKNSLLVKLNFYFFFYNLYTKNLIPKGQNFFWTVAPLRLSKQKNRPLSTFSSVQFSSVAQSRLTLCDPMNRSTPGLPVHHQLPEFKLMSIESVMPSSHLILCRLLLLLPPIPPSMRVFYNESTLCMRWPKYWSFSFSIIPSKEIPGLISFRMDWLDLLAV